MMADMIRLKKRLAMPEKTKAAAKEAGGSAPDYKEAIPKKMMKEGGEVEERVTRLEKHEKKEHAVPLKKGGKMKYGGKTGYKKGGAK